ncbi:unnamed protein product [Orchesella dallaii]|uniref:Uncharacterized protein n=1 Tax=Orchesella dallaii TaxID=48710 RepID=A0ABP1QE81_9HEXA
MTTPQPPLISNFSVLIGTINNEQDGQRLTYLNNIKRGVKWQGFHCQDFQKMQRFLRGAGYGLNDRSNDRSNWNGLVNQNADAEELVTDDTTWLE